MIIIVFSSFDLRGTFGEHSGNLWGTFGQGPVEPFGLLEQKLSEFPSISTILDETDWEKGAVDHLPTFFQRKTHICRICLRNLPFLLQNQKPLRACADLFLN